MKALKIIATESGPALLGRRALAPSAQWLRQQIVRPVAGMQWFKAYPLSGGAMLIQEHLLSVLRDATEEEVERATRNNPAADEIRALAF